MNFKIDFIPHSYNESLNCRYYVAAELEKAEPDRQGV